jgi:hypothetical protein
LSDVEKRESFKREAKSRRFGATIRMLEDRVEKLAAKIEKEAAAEAQPPN